jgi:hypothetical protein
VKVTGYTKYDNTILGGINIEFAKDNSKKNNTAVQGTVKSNQTTGYYSIDLQPGMYNVTAQKKDGNTIIYSYDAKLNITVGKGTYDYNIILAKNTVTITGITKDEKGTVIGGVSIEYEPDGSVVNNTAVAPGTPTSNEATGLYTIELKPGYYNITSSKKEGQTIVYYNEIHSKKIINESKTVDITVSKKSVSVGGTVKYNGATKENISIYFIKNESIAGNNADDYALTTSDKNGFYAVELAPGYYNITAFSEMFNISGVNYAYINTTETNQYQALEDSISMGDTFNIKLEMKEEETE